MFLFDASNLSTENVVVYSDRAEVCKQIEVNLQPGVNEIVVNKLSDCVQQDSIRVEGRGSTTAVIAEVKFQEKTVVKEDSLRDQEKSLNEQLKRLKDEKRDVQQHLGRLNKQKEVLDGLAEQLSGSKSSQGKDGKAKSPDFLASGAGADALDKLEAFLKLYQTRTSAIDESTRTLNKKTDELDEQIHVVSQNLRSSCCVRRNTVKQVTIIVNASEACGVVLDLFYIVCRTQWTPSYDIRVQIAEETMKIFYYGSIRQKTGEDWTNSKLTLSTALPKIGGEIPELKTTKISFYRPPKPIIQEYRSAPKMKMVKKSLHHTMAYADFEEEGDYASEEIAPMQISTAVAKENVTSTTFEIANRTSIPSDGSDHKVTIAIIDLKSKFEYLTVPSKCAYVYLMAKLINSSTYPILSGPAAVFVGSSFVANTQLKSVNVKEQLEVSLGIDPSIKIEYRAPRKFNEEYGVLSRSSVITNEQKIYLHNTKTAAVQLVVTEPVPQSTDEKLKITLLEPDVNKKDKLCEIVLNKHNNVEWTIAMKPDEKRCLTLKYQLECPKNETLEYKEEL